MSSELSSNFLQFGIGMTNPADRSIYEFDQFRLDTPKLMLYRDGREVTLPPKVIKTLAVLVENRGEILSKDELMHLVWDDSVVEESNLSQYLYLLRKTLGEKPDGGNYIETLRRRGYRFNGDVELLERNLTERTEEEHHPNVAHRLKIERHGNVLRLVDRAPESRPFFPPDADSIPASPDVQLQSAGNQRPIAAALAVTAVIAAGLLYLWLRPANRVVEARNEMSVSRLTNGAFPFSATVSRDGKYFAYTEIEGETSQMWLQSVGEANRIKVAESPDKLYGMKTFSPDGRSLYFAMSEKTSPENISIYRMPVMGGPSTKILDRVSTIVSFSPDGGEVAFGRRDKSKGISSIFIADNDGRNERTVLERKEPLILTTTPAWSPDGQTIVFSEFGPGGSGFSNRNRIYALDIASGSVRDASAENWDTAYSTQWMRDKKGFVIIGTRENDSYSTRRDQVYYISFPEGVSRRITTDAMRHEPASLGVTDDGSIVTVMSNRSSQIWSMNINGDSATAVQVSRGANDGRAGLAPIPGGKLGFVTYTSEYLSVWSMNGDGSDMRQLTTSPLIVEELRPDPLGRYFVFSSPTERHNHLFRINIDGSELTQLTFGNGYEIDSSVSPDGVWVAYGSTEDNGKGGLTRLFRSPIDGGESSLFGDNQCSRPSYSPDGKYVVCLTDSDRELLLISAADGSRVRSFETPIFATVNSGVRWLPDSSGIAYICSDKESSNLWVQPVGGEKPSQLTNFTSGLIFNFAFSSEGSRIYLARGYPIQDAIMISDFR